MMQNEVYKNPYTNDLQSQFQTTLFKLEGLVIKNKSSLQVGIEWSQRLFSSTGTGSVVETVQDLDSRSFNFMLDISEILD